MLGERSDQRGLWEADRLYLDHVGKDTFYGLLASLRGRLFQDSDFAVFYCADNGRDSVPPSLLATALLLQTHDKVSDAEAKARADFDIRWKVALGIEVEDRPFAKSTLQVFRAQLILHDRVREVFESSLRLARESGYLKRRSMKVALDTTNILGRGAVRDTFNLLADGIVKLLRALAQVEGISVGKWAKARGYGRYLASSIKGEATIDWSDKRARTALLAGIVGDADRLLELSRLAQGELPEDGAERQQIVAAAELLGQLLLQDIERKGGDGDGDGVSLKDGVSKDRMMSVHDPEMRHGHKSSRRRFDGHKAAIVVDTDTQLITAVEVLPGNAPDNLGALELVEQSEANTGVPVQEAMGDAAYGDGATRQTFADAGRTLIARVPGRPDRQRFPKNDFVIDLVAGSCTCPAGQVTHTIVPAGRRTDAAGRIHHLQAFQFDGSECMTCPLRSQCISAKGRKGRRVLIHPQEALLQQARALQQSAGYDEYRARRVVVEHRFLSPHPGLFGPASSSLELLGLEPHGPERPGQQGAGGRAPRLPHVQNPAQLGRVGRDRVRPEKVCDIVIVSRVVDQVLAHVVEHPLHRLPLRPGVPHHLECHGRVRHQPLLREPYLRHERHVLVGKGAGAQRGEGALVQPAFVQQVDLVRTILHEASNQDSLAVRLGQVRQGLQFLPVHVLCSDNQGQVILMDSIAGVVPRLPVAVNTDPFVDAQAVQHPVQAVDLPADDVPAVGLLFDVYLHHHQGDGLHSGDSDIGRPRVRTERALQERRVAKQPRVGPLQYPPLLGADSVPHELVLRRQARCRLRQQGGVPRQLRMHRRCRRGTGRRGW